MDITGKKILITGASGSLGKQLIYEFQRQGIKPVAHLRETSEAAYIDSLNLEKRYADLRNKNEIADLVQGIDAVIHTAAWVNFRKDRLTQFTGINTFGAVDLFQAARKAGVTRFVQVSTVAAIGALSRKSRRRQDHLFVTEDDEFNLGHLTIPYIMTKHAAEKELQDLAAEGGTELIIVNPSIMIAPSRTGDDRGKALKSFSRFLIPEFPNRVNLVDIRDVAPGIIAALVKGRAGQRYILAGDNITIRDLVLSISVELGRSPHLIRIPRPLLDFLARASVFLTKLTGRGKVSFYPDLVRMIDYDWAYSSRKARTELGYKNRSIHTSLNELLENDFTGTYLKPREDD